MKVRFIIIIMLMSIFISANEGCELPKLEKTNILEEKKDAGCKIEKTSEDLVTCLLNAKNTEEEKKCHSKGKNKGILPVKDKDLLKKESKINKTEDKE